MSSKSNFYKNFSINFRNNEYEKFRRDIKDTSSKYEDELIKYTNRVPYWETYLNDNQTKITKMFLNTKNASMIDTYLKLPKGTTWHILFSNHGKNGVLGKLKKVYNKL